MMWPFRRDKPTYAEWRDQAQNMTDLANKRGQEINQLLKDNALISDVARVAQFNLEKIGNLPPAITIGIPQGHDPRDDLPTDVLVARKRLDAAKRNYALLAVEYDELDRKSVAVFDQLTIKLATAVSLLTPAKKIVYIKHLIKKGWHEPMTYEKDTV